MSNQHDDHELRDIQSALRSLAPAPCSFNVDEIIYSAGQRSTRLARQRWVWPAVSVVSATCAMAFAVLWLKERTGFREFVAAGTSVRIAGELEPSQPTSGDDGKPEDPSVGKDARLLLDVQNPAFKTGRAASLTADRGESDRSSELARLSISFRQLRTLVLLGGIETLPERQSTGPARSSNVPTPGTHPFLSVGLPGS